MTQQERKVAQLLKKVGVPPHLKGYEFIKTAVLMMLEDNTLIRHITKGLYLGVAQKHKTTASKVERAIRHAAEVAYMNMPIETYNELFGYTVNANCSKAPNSHFLAALAETIKMEENDESEENTNEKKSENVIHFVDSRGSRTGVLRWR